MPFGHYLAVDLYDCDPEIVDSIKDSYKFLIDIVNILGMEKQSPPIVFRVDLDDAKYADKAGISAFVPLIESGVQLHTITPKGFVSIDVYSCSEIPIDKTIEFCKRFWKAGKVETNYLERGKDYVH